MAAPTPATVTTPATATVATATTTAPTTAPTSPATAPIVPPAVATPTSPASSPPPAVNTATTGITGRRWHVDAQAGHDGNPGTAASPWKTLARAAGQALAAGDAVLLKCGGLWRESFTIDRSNAPAGGVTLGAWGDCTGSNPPVVSGAQPLNGAAWSQAAGFAGRPVYSTAWSRPLHALHWNGQPLVRARYPNDGGVGREFALIAAVSNGRTLTPAAPHAAALAAVSLAGAKAIIRTNPWLVESHDVQGSDASGNLTLQQLAIYAPQAGQGFYVEGKLALLDTAGEWFHDSAAGRLYVWLPDGQSPSTATLEAVERSTAVKVDGVPDVRLHGVAVRQLAGPAVHVHDAPRTLLASVTVSHVVGHGVLVDGSAASPASQGTVIRDSAVRNAGVMGISAASPAVQVLGSRIEQTGATGSGVTAGIHLRSAGSSVRDNVITGSAFAAIVLSHPSGNTVSGNTLVNACQRFTDCGAIYTGGAPDGSARTQIRGNLISDMVPNAEGAIGGAAELVAGIYMDEDSAAHDVLDNLIGRVGVGVNLHNSAQHLVQGNRVWLASQSSIRVHNSSAGDKVRGNVVQDNQLFASRHLVAAGTTGVAPTERLVHAQEWVHGSNAAALFSGANPNVVRRNVTTTLSGAATARWSLIGGWNQQSLNLAQWSAHAGSETVQAIPAARPFLVTAAAPGLLDNPGFSGPSGWTFWTASPAAGGSMQYGTCGGACGDFAPGLSSDVLMSNGFQMSTSGGSLYALRTRARALAAGATLTMAVNRNGGDHGQLGVALMDVPVSDASDTHIDALFNATSNEAARLNFSAVPGRPVRLRETSLVRVQAFELFSPWQESALLGNPTASPRSVDCPSAQLRSCQAVDLAGRAVAWPVVLAPGGGLVVLSADGKWRTP